MTIYYLNYWKDGLANVTTAEIYHPVSVLNEILLPGERVPRLVERVVVSTRFSGERQAGKISEVSTTLYLDEEMTEL